MQLPAAGDQAQACWREVRIGGMSGGLRAGRSESRGASHCGMPALLPTRCDTLCVIVLGPNMRHALLAVALVIAVGLWPRPSAAAPELPFVEYQGQRFVLSKAYADFHDYKDDQHNLTPAQVKRAESLMRLVKFGPRFKTSGELDAALAGLQFPGYGLFYANQLGAHIDPKLELVYVEVPARKLNRYIALERQADGEFLVVSDFVAAAEPEIVRVKRSAKGALEFHQQDGKVIVPVHR